MTKWFIEGSLLVLAHIHSTLCLLQIFKHIIYIVSGGNPLSAITTIETFLEITICENLEKTKKKKCKNCPLMETLKELLAQTKKEKLLRMGERV